MRSTARVLNLFQQPKKAPIVRRVLISFLHPVISGKTPRANSRCTFQRIYAEAGIIRHDVQTRMHAVEPGLGQRILLESGKHFDVVFAGKPCDSKIQQGGHLEGQSLQEFHYLTHFVGIAGREEELPWDQRERALLAHRGVSDRHGGPGIHQGPDMAGTVQREEQQKNGQIQQ